MEGKTLLEGKAMHLLAIRLQHNPSALKELRENSSKGST